MPAIEREQLKTHARSRGSTRSFGKSVHLDKKKHGTVMMIGPVFDDPGHFMHGRRGDRMPGAARDTRQCRGRAAGGHQQGRRAGHASNSAQ